MGLLDYSLIIIYFVLLFVFGLFKKLKAKTSAVDLILDGRLLTLPAFVASLVSTWYGGILGVGEYSYLYGISNWLVFGVPYYLAALLFALFLAKKARESEVLTIPDRLAATYGKNSAVAGSVIIYFMTIPAAYVLMIGTLGQYLFGWDLWVGIIIGTIFSLFYVFTGGFKSVVRTDLYQFVLMFLGFIILFVMVVYKYGGIDFLTSNVPKSHFTWHGGNSSLYIISWYFIALATLVEPAFFQRCYAAKSSKTARNGIFVSIGFWIFFDFLTTSCGLYAKAILPNLDNAVGSYPALAMEVLPVGLLGIFFLSLLATIMSTVDSYSFLAATTFSRDIVMRLFKIDESKVVVYTRVGLVLTAVVTVIPLLFIESVVDLWHLLGSIGTPALLVPVFFSFVGKRRMPGKIAFVSIISSALLSLIWYYSKIETADDTFWFGIEPIFPGLLLSILLYLIFARKTK